MSVTAGAQSRATVSATVAAASVAPDGLARARLDGSLAANRRGTRAYFAGGMLSGATLAFVGTGIGYAVAGHTKVGLPTGHRLTIADSSEAYKRAFTRSYADRVKQKRKSSVLAGGVAGTLIVLAIISGPQIGRVH